MLASMTVIIIKCHLLASQYLLSYLDASQRPGDPIFNRQGRVNKSQLFEKTKAYSLIFFTARER